MELEVGWKMFCVLATDPSHPKTNKCFTSKKKEDRIGHLLLSKYQI